MADTLKQHIYEIGDPLRNDRAGEMIDALTTLPKEAAQSRATLKCAFYELDDPEVIDTLKPLLGSLNLILTNMPGKDDNGHATNDVYEPEREAMKAAGADVIDRSWQKTISATTSSRYFWKSISLRRLCSDQPM